MNSLPIRFEYDLAKNLFEAVLPNGARFPILLSDVKGKLRSNLELFAKACQPKVAKVVDEEHEKAVTAFFAEGRIIQQCAVTGPKRKKEPSPEIYLSDLELEL